MSGRRIVKVRLGNNFMLGMLRGHGFTEVESSWPDDAKIIDVSFDPAWGQTIMTVESSMFAEIPEGGAIPNWEPIYSAEVTLASEWLKVIRAGMTEDDTWPLT